MQPVTVTWRSDVPWRAGAARHHDLEVRCGHQWSVPTSRSRAVTSPWSDESILAITVLRCGLAHGGRDLILICWFA